MWRWGSSSGESFSGIEPGQRFPGREKVVESAVHGALIPTVRAELRTADRLADPKTAPGVQRVIRAANLGIRQVGRALNLLIRGDIPGFERAQALAERYDLSGC